MLHSDTELAALLGQVKTIAIVGAKDKPGQPVDRVGRYLIEAGFTVIPVHPKRTSVWGLAAYISAEARGLLRGTGMVVVEDRCLMVDHARLLGGGANG